MSCKKKLNNFISKGLSAIPNPKHTVLLFKALYNTLLQTYECFSGGNMLAKHKRCQAQGPMRRVLPRNNPQRQPSKNQR